MSAVWSLSMFNGEIDVLEIRMRELDNVVDWFVLAESPLTHSGEPNEMTLMDNWDRLRPWWGRIRRVEVDARPDLPNWTRERRQRSLLAEGLDGVHPDDLIVLSDVDEIPSAAVVADAVMSLSEPIGYDLLIHVYRLDWRWQQHVGGCQLRMFRHRHLGGDPLDWMHTRLLPTVNVAVGHGWHLTYMGDARFIRRKILSIADDWVRENPGWAELPWIEESISTGRDVFARADRQALPVPLHELPACVSTDPDRWAHLLRLIGSSSH